METSPISLIPSFNYLNAGPIRNEFLSFWQRFAEKVGPVVNFEAFFADEVLSSYSDNRNFAVQIFNPQSFSAVNNYNHRVGDLVRDQMVKTIISFYQKKGIKVKVFALQGINRAVLLEGVTLEEARRYASELKHTLESGKYQIEIAPNEIENPLTREAFKEYIAKQRGIPVASVNENFRYRVNLKNIPLVKSNGSVVEKFRINVGLFHYAHNSKTSKYSPESLESAARALLNKLNQDNPAEILEVSLKEILKEVPEAFLPKREPSLEVKIALQRLITNEKLRERILELPKTFQEELASYFKNLLPRNLQKEINSIEIRKTSKTTAVSPYLGNEGEIIVPLTDALGKKVAEVVLYGKNNKSFAAISSKLDQVFNLEERILGGLAFKWNASLYLDPKSDFYTNKTYYKILNRLHKQGKNYILVRGDINYFGSWVDFNHDFSIMGTELGDTIFKDFAGRLLKFFKKNGMPVQVCRLGGDEIALIFTGNQLTRETVAAKLQEFGQEMMSAKLLYPLDPKTLSPSGQKSLEKYIKKFNLTPNADGTYTVDLYQLERFAKKYGRFVKGMGVSFGIHKEINPKEIEAEIKKAKPNISRTELRRIIKNLIRQYDAEADAIAGHAKNGTKNGLIKICLDRRDGTRIILDETDHPIKTKNPFFSKIISQIAKTLGIAEDSSPQKVQEEIGKRFGKHLGKWLSSNRELAVKFRESVRYQKFLKFVAQQAFAQAGKGTQRAVSAASFATGILSFFAVEEILDIIGVENKSARFALVLGGGHVVSQGANSLLSSAVTAEGRAYLSALVKNPPAALVNGLKNANWISGTSNLLTGVGYAILTSNLYNHILNAYGVSADSWLRGAFPQFVVGMGGGTALGTAAARTALGRAAIPLAVAHLASTVINLFDSDYEQSVQERAHEAMRLDLAKGGTLDHVLLMTDIVANLISGGAFGESALSQSDLNQVARADAQLLAELQPQLLNALRSRWMADLLHYDGSAQDLNFFTNPELSTKKLAEILKQEVRFENQRKIIGYRTESGSCSIWHGEYMCGPDRTIPIYDANSPEIREKSAYEDIVAGRLNLNRPDLKEVLRNEYNIQDPDAFLQKVEVANLQKLVRYLVSLEPDTIDPSTLNIADNRELRAIFDKAGHLRPGKEQRLIAWLGKDQPLKELITEFRKMTRLQALLKGAQPTEVDKQLGLVKSDGSINESSPTFATLRQAVEQAFFMTTSSQ